METKNNWSFIIILSFGKIVTGHSRIFAGIQDNIVELSIKQPEPETPVIPEVGQKVDLFELSWTVVHDTSGTKYCILTDIYSEVIWGQTGQDYKDSEIYQQCVNFDNTHKLSDNKNLINLYGTLSFIPTYDQVSGEFSWFDSNPRRVAYYNGSTHIWATQTKQSSGSVYYVGSSGAINYGGVSGTTGFRPCIAIKIV